MRQLMNAGFSDIQFYPFEIPIDLPEPNAASDLTTYTRRTEIGSRLQFRGSLYQPWCHLTARKII